MARKDQTMVTIDLNIISVLVTCRGRKKMRLKWLWCQMRISWSKERRCMELLTNGTSEIQTVKIKCLWMLSKGIKSLEEESSHSQWWKTLKEILSVGPISSSEYPMIEMLQLISERLSSLSLPLVQKKKLKMRRMQKKRKRDRRNRKKQMRKQKRKRRRKRKRNTMKQVSRYHIQRTISDFYYKF